MIKNNKALFIITSVIILLPMAAGLILWGRLPDVMATHFGAASEPNRWNSKAFTVFALPGFILAIHWLALYFTDRDNRNTGNSQKILKLLFWICPCASVLTCGLTYAYALGVEMDIGLIVVVFVGALLVVVGNFLPKCQPNRTVGIRIPWTLADPENWRCTHRMAGWTFCIGGALTIILAFLPWPWVTLCVMLAAILTPVVYSGIYWARHR